MDAYEFKQIDNLLKEVAGGLPYEVAKEELEALCEVKPKTKKKTGRVGEK